MGLILGLFMDTDITINKNVLDLLITEFCYDKNILSGYLFTTFFYNHNIIYICKFVIFVYFLTN